MEGAAQGVRVNALCPGWTATELNRNLWEDDTAGKATVVYLTRTADVPMAGLNLKRTAIFQLSGGALTEVSHTDVSYTP